MSKSNSKPMAWQAYLDLPTKMDRVAFLNSLNAEENGLSLRFVKDILSLELHIEEKIALLRVIQHKDDVMFEDFVTRQLLNWPQDLAVTALKCWASESRHQLWHRIPGLVNNSHISQRLVYTIVDLALVTGGHAVIDHVLGMDNFTELSPAFQALCLLQATYWNRPSPLFAEAANRQLEYLHHSGHPEQKVLPSALSYVARFHPKTLHALVTQLPANNPWRDLIHDICSQLTTNDIDQIIQKALQQKNQNIAAIWPPVWQRHQLSVNTIAQAFSTLDQVTDGDTTTFKFASFFLGCSHDVLEDALLTQKDDVTLRKYLGRLHHLIRHPYSERLATRLSLQESAEVKSEQQAWLKGKTQFSFECPDSPIDERTSPQLASFYEFFQTVHQDNRKDNARTPAKQKAPNDANYLWHKLSQAWLNPEKSQLESLAQSARKEQGIYQICYLKTLARFKGSDEAALKMLDFTRSQDEDILRHVIQALHAIGTPRALQEMVAAITRPNLTHELQVELVQLLSQHDLQPLQAEIRSAISDLIPPPNTNSTPYDIREMLSELLVPPGSSSDDSVRNTMANTHSEYNEKALDQELQNKIAHYQFLSSEVKRALRTSLFFDLQVAGSKAVSSMDLSPVVDMQYKALELLFREMFESPCHKIIQSGVPQRKLDVVGYARPVVKAMDEFESYIANHPIIREIPFFSKFKLRKMLRAICQYRPGRRFTLDGLKAFGLFFLVFSRSNCKYGLQNLLPLGLRSDEELFQFCKTLHTMQDVRNRAAHEGFHPDASNNIEGIWQTTASIIAVAAKASNTNAPQSKAS